jgi:hypothetical protein
VDATPLLSPVCGSGQGPRLVVTSLGNPVGPTSTSPRACHGWTRRPPCFSSHAWWIKLVPGSFDVKPWSGPVLKKSFKWRALFLVRICTLSVGPEPLAIWNKKLEGLEFWLLKKLKISSDDIYPTAPEHLFEFFLIVENSDRGSFIVFLGSQLYIRGWW